MNLREIQNSVPGNVEFIWSHVVVTSRRVRNASDACNVNKTLASPHVMFSPVLLLGGSGAKEITIDSTGTCNAANKSFEMF